MKILLAAVLLVHSFYWTTHEKGNPLIKFSAEIHDFGVIQKGKPVKIVFKFRNVGSEPLIIYSVETTCGCTAASYTKTPILKDKEGFVNITFDAQNVGKFHKPVIVKSNSKSSVQVIYVKGEVKAKN